ncbi:MAG: MmgE/PrpD family protein [Ramlibacter sp.]|uniref:MmgE/PrpD family protein n=1 Tax=Ramlibacter sp. TaxID=1917967 RepID=UPI00260DA9A5|nr:MmgE/PrpD family protein [Ramlibacter sp.]MDH4378265.1 MmgE/PrpD family protein [Ramlibacter sp.]
METETLARFVAQTRHEDIPPEARRKARHALVDTLGVALAGHRESVSQLALRWVEDVGARPQATLWGHGHGTSAAEAAFANAVSAHALDFDDSLPTLRGHPSATLLAAALAVGEAVKASGSELVTAYALGLEVAGKLGRALGDDHYLRGWHTSSTVGVFSCAAAAARLWKLDTEATRAAFGLAASQMAGLVSNFGTMSKPFHMGQAAHAGVRAAWLAREGFSANPSVFEAPGGVIAVYGGPDGESLDALVSRLGAPWELLAPGINVKRWPCCYASHRPLSAFLAIKEAHGLNAGDIESVDVGFVPGNDAALISRSPDTGLAAKFSVEYAVAAAVIDGRVSMESFTDARVQRPAVRELMARVHRHEIAASELAFPAQIFATVSVRTARGVFQARADHAPGSTELGMTDADRREKFLECTEALMDEASALTLMNSIDHCETLPDISALVQALKV